jgi:hypothetical protein
MTTHRAAHRVSVAAIAIALLLSGCAASTPEPAERSGSGELRHDLEPLTDRFPTLADTADTTDATWMSGTLGDDRVPGPSTYWIDAVVTLDEADYAALQAEVDAQPTTDAPDVDAGLEDELPDGPFLRSDALDTLFSPDGYASTVFLDDATRTIVLSSRFE